MNNHCLAIEYHKTNDIDDIDDVFDYINKQNNKSDYIDRDINFMDRTLNIKPQHLYYDTFVVDKKIKKEYDISELNSLSIGQVYCNMSDYSMFKFSNECDKQHGFIFFKPTGETKQNILKFDVKKIIKIFDSRNIKQIDDYRYFINKILSDDSYQGIIMNNSDSDSDRKKCPSLLLFKPLNILGKYYVIVKQHRHGINSIITESHNDIINFIPN